MADDSTTFRRGPARRPAPHVADPLLQWATGLQTKARTLYAGWLVEAGKIEALDGAMAAANFSQVTIKHGSGNLVNHWAMDLQHIAGRIELRAASGDAGMAFLAGKGMPRAFVDGWADVLRLEPGRYAAEVVGGAIVIGAPIE